MKKQYSKVIKKKKIAIINTINNYNYLYAIAIKQYLKN